MFTCQIYPNSHNLASQLIFGVNMPNPNDITSTLDSANSCAAAHLDRACNRKLGESLGAGATLSLRQSSECHGMDRKIGEFMETYGNCI